MSLAYLLADEARLGDLLTALRRHDRDDSLRRLRAWCDRPTDGPADRWSSFGKDCRELTLWVQREALLHLEGDRPEYALCLIERYRPQVGERGSLSRQNGQGLLP